MVGRAGARPPAPRPTARHAVAGAQNSTARSSRPLRTSRSSAPVVSSCGYSITPDAPRRARRQQRRPDARSAPSASARSAAARPPPRRAPAPPRTPGRPTPAARAPRASSSSPAGVTPSTRSERSSSSTPSCCLELPDRRAQRRLRDVQPLGRARDVALLRDRDEVADEPQLRLHRRSLWHPNQPVLDGSRRDRHPRAHDQHHHPRTSSATRSRPATSPSSRRSPPTTTRTPTSRARSTSRTPRSARSRRRCFPTRTPRSSPTAPAPRARTPSSPPSSSTQARLHERARVRRGQGRTGRRPACRWSRARRRRLTRQPPWRDGDDAADSASPPRWRATDGRGASPRARSRSLAVIAATLAGGYLAFVSYRQVRSLSVGEIRLSVAPGHSGALDVYVPLVDWGARFEAIRLPVRLRVDVRTVDRDAAAAGRERRRRSTSTPSATRRATRSPPTCAR